MRCDWFKKNLSAYIDGEVNFLTRWRIKRHLKSCADCYKDYIRLKNLRKISKIILLKNPEPGFYERLQAKLPRLNPNITLKKTGSLAKFWMLLPLPGKLAIGGVAILILFLLIIYPHLSGSSLNINKFEEEYLRSKEIFSVVEEPAPPLLPVSEER